MSGRRTVVATRNGVRLSLFGRVLAQSISKFGRGALRRTGFL